MTEKAHQMATTVCIMQFGPGLHIQNVWFHLLSRNTVLSPASESLTVVKLSSLARHCHLQACFPSHYYFSYPEMEHSPAVHSGNYDVDQEWDEVAN